MYSSIERKTIRRRDRAYFKKVMPNFILGKEIHHDWENGGVCYIMLHKEHLAIHGRKDWTGINHKRW